MGRHHALKPNHLFLSPPQPSRSSSYYSSTSFLHGTSTTALAVGGRIPGFKVSAAFLTSLHSNIFIDLDSCSNSGANTPDSLRPVNPLPPPSPLVYAMSSHIEKDMAPLSSLNLPKPRTDVDEDKPVAVATTSKDPGAIPELSTFPATDTDSRVEALHMVADSVAQQRNIGARTIIYSPFTLAFSVALLAVLRQVFTKRGETDYVRVATTFTGLVMTLFVTIRWACGGYINEAERVGTWKWLNQGRSAAEEEESSLRVLGDADEILLTKFGEVYIGAIIFRGVQYVNPSSSPSKRTRKSQSSANQPKLQIRGWTVKQKYRRKGVGSALIEEALKVGREKGWTTGGVEFAEDHANHKRILPPMLNGGFDKFDRIAGKILGDKLKEFEAGHDSKGRRKR